jgi:pheromone shutdown protein TraB
MYHLAQDVNQKTVDAFENNFMRDYRNELWIEKLTPVLSDKKARVVLIGGSGHIDGIRKHFNKGKQKKRQAKIEL